MSDDLETKALSPVVPPQDPEPSDMKPKTKWVRPAVITGGAILVVALVAGGVVWHARATETARQSALAACQSSVQAASKAREAFTQTQSDVKPATEITADQVTDAALVDTLKAQAAPTGTVPVCDADASQSTLDESKGQADAVKTSYETAAQGLKDAADQVTASRDQKNLDTAKTQADQAKADGQALYDQSNGKVADENTRTTLKAALDGMKVDTVDDVNASIQAIRSAMDQVNASIQAKTDADNAAQAEAQRQAEAGNGSSSNGGSSAQRNTGSSSNVKKNSGSSSSKNNNGSGTNKSNSGSGATSGKNNNGSSNSGSSSNGGGSSSNNGEGQWVDGGTITNGEIVDCRGHFTEVEGMTVCVESLGR